MMDEIDELRGPSRHGALLLILAFCATAYAYAIFGLAPEPGGGRHGAVGPFIGWLTAGAMQLAGQLLFVAGASGRALVCAGWRRTVARLSAAAFTLVLAQTIWSRVSTSALWPGGGPGWPITVTSLIAFVALVAVGAPRPIATGTRPVLRGLRTARGGLTARIAVSLVAGAALAILVNMRHVGDEADVVWFGIPLALLCVHLVLFIATAQVARAAVAGLPRRRLAVAALLIAVALAFDLDLFAIALAVVGGRFGVGGPLATHALAWIAPAVAALGLVLFASATTQMAIAVADRHLATTQVGASMMLVIGAALPGALVEVMFANLFSPGTPATLTILVIGIAGVAAASSALLRAEVAATARVLEADAGRSPELPPMVARTRVADGPRAS
jgi:hypothetical protein